MKRHRSEEESPERRSSPSDTSSHGEGDMADTEMEGGPRQSEAGPSHQAQGVEEAAHASQPPVAKKKRTRTLTTPHQSAVLHALLAQSRFPTTAMREEVGRSIGLSARKVQVWFQNQRQKARRPRSQSVAPPLTRPPQYGAFPNTPTSAPATSSDPYGLGYAGPSSGYSSYPGPSPHPGGSQEYADFENTLRTPATGTSSSSSGHLSGPGVPGSTTPYLPRFPYGVPPLQPLAHPPPSAYPYGFLAEPWSAHEGPSGGSRPMTEPAHRDFSYNLPPLRLDEGRGAGPSSSALPRLTPSRHFDASPRPFTAESPFAHHPPLDRPSSQSMRSMRPLPRLQIPPSQPLQSPSQWQGPPLPPPVYDRPSASDVGRSVQPSESYSAVPQPAARPPGRQVAQRATRYDPVRAAVSEHEGSGGSQTQDAPTHTPPREYRHE